MSILERTVPTAAGALPIGPRTAAVLVLASVVGLMMLCWPLLLVAQPGDRVEPPFMFLALLPLVMVVVLAEMGEGGMDSRVLAVLGVLSAINAVMRGLGAGTAGHRAGVLPPRARRSRVRGRLRLRRWAVRRCSPPRC